MLDYNRTAPECEQNNRSAERFALLLRPVKVLAGTGEYLAILRDVSASGLRLRLFHPLPGDPRMVIELANGDRYEASKVWERDGQAGFEFTAPVDVARLIEEQNRFRKRQVRVLVDLPARIFANGEASEAVIRDLSQQGGRIETGAQLALDQRIRIEAQGLPPIDAKVRWRRAPHAGLIFEQTFKLDELARLVATLQPLQRGVQGLSDDPFTRIRQA